MDADTTLIIVLLIGFIQLVMLFAQLKLFEINKTVKKILEELKKKDT